MAAALRNLRRPISLTLAAMIIGALALVGVATLGLTLAQLDSIHETEVQLKAETRDLAIGINGDLSPGRGHDDLDVLRTVASLLKGPLGQQAAVMVVNQDGTFVNPLNLSQRIGLVGGLSWSDILPGLITGGPVSGHVGRLAWAAILVAVPTRLPDGIQNEAVVLTRKAPPGLGAAGRWFVIALVATIVAALVAAYRLGWRLTHRSRGPDRPGLRVQVVQNERVGPPVGPLT